jgi:hypothetical protein
MRRCDMRRLWAFDGQVHHGYGIIMWFNTNVFHCPDVASS